MNIQSEALSELLVHPEIKELIEFVRKQFTLAEIIGEQHTTQAFETAEQIRLAFMGALEKMPDSLVQAKMDQVNYSYDLEVVGITDDDLRKLFEKVWIYSRLTNPTIELLEEVLSDIEETEATAVFASGLAAINATVQQFTNPGDKIMVIGSMYGGTYAQMQRSLKQTGREFMHMPISEFEGKGLPEGVKMVFFEACNNPTLRLIPLDKVVEVSRKVGALTVCDNTFTPLCICPSEWGVDLTVHSMTKYLGGRSEDLGGSVSGRADMIAKLSDLHEGERMTKGAVMAPRVAKQFLQNLEDLPQRLFKSTRNARGVRELAERFGVRVRTIEKYDEFGKIRNSRFPDSIANGMVALYFKNAEEAHEFVDTMIEENVGAGAVSLGAETTYYCVPAETTHSEMSRKERKRIGIKSGLVRISCGTESDLLSKMEQVLKILKEKESR